MKPEFFVEVVGFRELREIAGVWAEDTFSAILETLDYGDTTDFMLALCCSKFFQAIFHGRMQLA